MIDQNSIRFMLGCHRLGVDFDTTLTLGSQEINFSTLNIPEACRQSQTELKIPESIANVRELFTHLKAGKLDEMDFSAYEGANILHNLNDPIPDQLSGQYSVVFDGGTLEHIFNAAEGIRNAMKMVKEGGHLILHNPSNNWFGHGFYQFSPEFYFRALSEENGFEIRRIVIHNTTDQWFEVKDPNEVRQRIELFGPERFMTLICARKVRQCDIFSRWPAQSDYSEMWTTDRTVSAKQHWLSDVRSKLKKLAPGWLLRFMHRHMGFLYRKYSVKNKQNFRQVDNF